MCQDLTAYYTLSRRNYIYPLTTRNILASYIAALKKACFNVCAKENVSEHYEVFDATNYYCMEIPNCSYTGK